MKQPGMIKNQRQYDISIERLRELRESRAYYEAHPQTDPLAQQAILASLDTVINDAAEELMTYQGLKNGTIATVSLSSLAELPDALIQARIAAGLSQKQLAERLDVSENAVQRDEAKGYAQATLDRLHRVAAVLSIEFSITCHLQHRERNMIESIPSGNQATLNNTASE